jgi:hypothetical protein
MSESFRVTFEHSPDCLIARLFVIALADHAPLVFMSVAAEARRCDVQRVLMDFRGLLGQLPPYEEAKVGGIAATCLEGLKCAFLIDEHRLNGIVSRTAAAGGLDCKSFSEEVDCRVWLADPPHGPAPGLAQEIVQGSR